MQYSAHDAYVAPARARPELWRIIVGFILILVTYALGIGVIFLLVLIVAGPQGTQRWMTEMMEATGPTGTLLLLATFIGMALGPMFAVAAIHRRRFRTLFGSLNRTFRHFVIAALVCGAAYSITFLLPGDVTPEPGLDRALWLSFLPLALVGVLVQTGAEELLFRGYLQQQIAARFRSPIVWMVLPSVLFALAHYQPDIMGDNAWFVVIAVALFAILAADLTAVTGSLGAAWGFHFANNVVAILIVAMDGPLSGLALYVAPFSAADEAIRPLILLDMGTTLATWILIRIAVMRFP